jgi:hypothetical protein
VKKIEKKYGIKISSKRTRGSAGAKNTTIWYQYEEDRDKNYIAYSGNTNYKKVEKVDKK